MIAVVKVNGHLYTMLRPSCVLALAIALSPIAWGQNYPSKPVRIIVPTTAGGTTDAIARTVAHDLGARLGQTVLIDNRPGAGAQIGIDATMKAAPDGYTLLISSNSILPVLKKVPPYDPAKDLTPITMIAISPIVYVVNTKLPASTLAEFLAMAKVKADAVRYGSAGLGSALHLSVEMLAAITGVQMLHVPYKGGTPMMTAIVAGDIEMVPTSPDFARRYMDSKQLKSLAQTGKTRQALLPEVATTTELGIPEVDVLSWFALFGPAKLPANIALRLASEIAAVVELPAVKQRIGVVGADPSTMTPEAFTRFVDADNQKWMRIVRNAKVPLQD
ncbi:MAG: tripartite tricarboxylate transporter substrate binding protein [Betaproteobacteria bacterium]|nr:tripartite tricarboxylate transporter substrate binding protein [Betaproteobacteria bacterium]